VRGARATRTRRRAGGDGQRDSEKSRENEAKSHETIRKGET